MPFVAVFGLYKTYLQAQHDGKKVFTIDMLYFGGNIGLNLLLVAVFKMGAMGIIYSTLANSFIFVGYFLIKEPQFFLPKLDLNAIKPLIKYSFPFIPFIFFGFLMENTDRLFLNSKSGSGDSGIYYIALTFASIFSIVKESLIGALRPWFFENYNEENFRKIGKIFLITLWGMAILAVGISAFSYETLFILSSNKELINAWKYIPLLVIGLFIVFVGQIYSLPTQHSSTAVKYLFIANFVGFIANLIISFLLIERYKIFGAVTAKIFAYTIMTLVLFVINNALTKFKLNPLYVFLPFLYSTILSLGVLVEISYPVNLTIKTIVLTVSVLLFGFYVNKTLGGLDQLKSIFIKSEHNN
jgi:O-antigen/teichoic acid export membrane protein